MSENQRIYTIKNMCAFLAEKEGTGHKIATVIKQLPKIKNGKDIFISYLSAEDINTGKLEVLLSKYTSLAKCVEQGQGWYFWSTSKELTLAAKNQVNDACTEWSARNMDFVARKKMYETQKMEQMQRQQKRDETQAEMVDQSQERPNDFPVLQKEVPSAWDE